MGRNTVQKTMILQTVLSMKNHPTADEIYDKVSTICPNISRGTVYRDLNQLADAGKVLRVAVANAPDRFDLTTIRHSHCLCSDCGRVFDYKLKVEPEFDHQENEGFMAISYDIIINGLCNKCKENKERNYSDK